MTAKIIPFTGITSLDMPPDSILEQSMGKLEGAVVIGFKEDGSFYAASSYADGATVLWLLELCKMKLMEHIA